MTAERQGQANGPGQAAGTPERAGDLRIGVVLEAFLDWPFEPDPELAAGSRSRRSPSSRSVQAAMRRTRTATWRA